MNYNRGFCRTYGDTNMCDRNNCAVPYGRTTQRRSVRNVSDSYEKPHTAQHLAMVYSPYQDWRDIYCGEKALENGTLFAELDKPFKGYKTNRGCSC